MADYNRFENAYSTGGVTKQQLDQTKLNLVTSKSRLQQAKVNVGDTIKSTINGIVNKNILNLVQFSVRYANVWNCKRF
jgi:hypothetical protein